MHDDLGREGEEDVFEEIQGEVEASEVVSVLEDLEDVALEGGRRGKKDGEGGEGRQLDLVKEMKLKKRVEMQDGL